MTAKPQDGITVEDQIARVFAWRRGFNAMHLIDVGLHLGLFKALRERPQASGVEIAAALGLHAPYVETWCLTAYSFGLLDGEEDDGGRRYRLAPHIDVVLASPGHPRYLGGYVRLGTEFATEDHRYCLDAFRSGATVPFQGRSDAFAEAVADGTFGLQVLSARKLLPELAGLKARLDAGGTVLELGCGTGRHLLQVAKAFPQARVIGVDIDPTGMKAARAAVEQAGLSERVTLVSGDVGEAVEAGVADAVVMIEVLHEIASQIRGRVISGCARALKSGGWLVIVDETYPSTLAEARERDFLFPIQTGFEELTWGNVLPTREEQERLLRAAGLSGEIQRSVIGEGFTVLAVQKD